MKRSSKCFLGILIFGCALLSMGVLHAAPRSPNNDDEVLATLPTRLNRSDAAVALTEHAERDARQALKENAANLPVALHLAKSAIDRSRQLGDPRELGQAQAALAHWWSQDAPPLPVQLLRATILQGLHDFDAARSDLDTLLKRPQLPLIIEYQALLTRAAIHQTQGRYDMALSDCQVLTRQHQQADVSWMGQVCEAELRSLQGRTTAAAQALALLAQRAPEAQAAWIALIRAELAVRMHDEAAAQAQFKRALQGHPDVYTLTVYVDWLLSSTTPRTQEVIQLLQGREDNDSLLLRLCIAYRQQNDPRLQAAAQQMRERFADALARGDTTHAREYGLFALYVDQNASEALRWAQQNWTLQREPIDARLLIEAARVAHQEATAQPALDVVQRWTVL